MKKEIKVEINFKNKNCMSKCIFLITNAEVFEVICGLFNKDLDFDLENNKNIRCKKCIEKVGE
jgi:hypothetical protein